MQTPQLMKTILLVLRELLAYYEREQYGDANVFYDTYYSNSFEREQDAKTPYKDDKPKYEKKKWQI